MSDHKTLLFPFVQCRSTMKGLLIGKYEHKNTKKRKKGFFSCQCLYPLWYKLKCKIMISSTFVHALILLLLFTTVILALIIT